MEEARKIAASLPDSGTQASGPPAPSSELDDGEESDESVDELLTWTEQLDFDGCVRY